MSLNGPSMASPAISTRLKYLNDSAHLLVTNAPATSAYLMSRCHDLMFENELEQTEAHKRNACGACGNIMLLGLTGNMHVQDMTTRKTKRSTPNKTRRPAFNKAKVVIYKCGLCSRQTRQSISVAVPRSARTKVLQSGLDARGNVVDVSTPSSQGRSSSENTGSASANASSRKRAKARKQSGLQALLAKSKEAETRKVSGGFGLDLLDMMKET